MNYKVALVFLIACMTLVVTNHVIVDWESVSLKQANTSLDRIVAMQYQDLLDWKEGKSKNDDFRKRTICRGRLKDWSDNRPFISKAQQDSLNVYSNELGVFIVQELKEGNCTYISCHQLTSIYAISNSFLKPGISSFFEGRVTNISVDSGSYSYRELLYFDLRVTPHRGIDAFLGFSVLVVLLGFYFKFSQTSLRNFWFASSVLLMIRLITLHFDVLQLLFRYTPFDPVNYTSHFFNPTLGDLLLNVVVLFLMLAASSTYYGRLRKLRYGIALYSGFSTLLAGLVLHIAWSIVSNSQLSLDIGASIQFDDLRLLVFLCILLAGIVYLYGTYLLLMLVRRSGQIIPAIAGVLIVSVFLVLADLLAITICLIHVSVVLIAIRYQLGTSFKDFTDVMRINRRLE